MKRREFLKATGAVAAHLLANSIVLTPALLRRAQADTGLPLASLRAALGPDALLLLPADTDFAKYQVTYNLRTQVVPQVRVLCRTPQAVSTTLQWIRSNQVPFSIRGGGHSYEGLSNSPGVVVDNRAMKSIQFDPETNQIAVGAGCALGEIYQALAEKQRAIPAGSCPTVGVSGHVLGGGYGLLGRSFGLACDNLESVELVDSAGSIVTASASENPDLFWALSGGGSGSLGVATRFVFRTHPLEQVSVFGVSWVLPVPKAVAVMKAWQAWAPVAPDSITSIFRVGRDTSGLVALRCVGQSTDSERKLAAEIEKLTRIAAPTKQSMSTKTFGEATRHFGGDGAYSSIFMKGKSDYAVEPMSDRGMATLMNQILALPTGAVVAMCDAYGGAVSRVASEATAFNHRNALYSIQYYSQWSDVSKTALRLEMIRAVHASMRPFVSGRAYVNYCDLDLKNWPDAYWGTNLERLKSVKRTWDPENFFRHAQSIPIQAS